MRLILWRDHENEEWRIYGHQRVAFGDKPASIDLELGIEIAADKGKHIDQEASKKLVKDRYVDDSASGGSKEAVMRMVGNMVEIEGKLHFDGTMSKILEQVGFRAKTFVVSGDDDPRVLSKSGKLLGVRWVPTNDTLEYKIVINLSKKSGAAR